MGINATKQLLIIVTFLVTAGVYFIQWKDDGSSLTNYYLEQSKLLKAKYPNIQDIVDNDALKLSTNTYVKQPLSHYIIDQDKEEVYPKENATLLMLVRNRELEGALDAMRSLEDRFNHKYHYDWIFLNDVPFDESFKEATTAMASGKTKYDIIPPEDWNCPPFINQTKYDASVELMSKNNVIYGFSRSYRNMCRFNSGFFFRQNILSGYDYYFRVEPDVKYFCDFPYDPFKVMRENKKKYGFVLSLYEYEETIPTLWQTVENYISLDNGDINMDKNAYDFLTDKSKVGVHFPVVESNSDYNLCHFWSNFEIGDLNFFRSEKYIKFFDYLDKSGGFYYERWGDAPVHSIIVSLLLDKDEIIHFDELGYHHPPFDTCPTSYYGRINQRCRCNASAEENLPITPSSCMMRWWKNGSGKYFLREDRRLIN